MARPARRPCFAVVSVANRPAVTPTWQASQSSDSTCIAWPQPANFFDGARASNPQSPREGGTGAFLRGPGRRLDAGGIPYRPRPFPGDDTPASNPLGAPRLS